MAKEIKSKIQKRTKKNEVLPLEKQNYVIIGIGLLAIIVGYIALMQDGVDGSLPLVVAPMLLAVGYCIIIPVGILYRRRETRTVEQGVPSLTDPKA